MGTTNRRRAFEADQSVCRQLEDWNQLVDAIELARWSGCPHGAYDEKDCWLCSDEDAGRDALADIIERSNRQGIVELVRRFGNDPQGYTAAVFREGCQYCAVDLICEGHPNVIEAREAQWELLRTILRQEPSPRSVDDRRGCYNPTTYGDKEPNSQLSRTRVLACGILSTVAPSPEATVKVLQEVLNDPDKWVRGEAIFQLAELAPEMPCMTALLLGMLPHNDRAVQALARIFRSATSSRSDIVEALLDTLTLGNADASRSAAEALGQVGQVSARILCALEDRGLHGEREVREPAFKAWMALQKQLREGRTGPLPQTEEEAFLLAIWDNPGDAVLPLIYADWLEERGHAERACVLRLEHEWFTRTPGDPREPALREAMQTARGKVDPTWLNLWHRLSWNV